MAKKYCSEFKKECKHATFLCGISREIAKAWNMEPHPHATITCVKFGETRLRNEALMKPLKQCRGKYYEPKE